jgi:uncharacterized protein with HEPN domain
MNRSDIDRLRDARNFARYARENAGGLSADTLADAIQPQHAALYDLVIIGETLNKVSSEVKTAAPDLPWRATNELRNLIVHAYWQIDLEIITGIIESEIDPPMQKLDKLISFLEQGAE